MRSLYTSTRLGTLVPSLQPIFSCANNASNGAVTEQRRSAYEWSMEYSGTTETSKTKNNVRALPNTPTLASLAKASLSSEEPTLSLWSWSVDALELSNHDLPRYLNFGDRIPHLAKQIHASRADVVVLQGSKRQLAQEIKKLGLYSWVDEVSVPMKPTGSLQLFIKKNSTWKVRVCYEHSFLTFELSHVLHSRVKLRVCNVDLSATVRSLNPDSTEYHENGPKGSAMKGATEWTVGKSHSTTVPDKDEQRQEMLSHINHVIKPDIIVGNTMLKASESGFSFEDDDLQDAAVAHGESMLTDPSQAANRIHALAIKKRGGGDPAKVFGWKAAAPEARARFIAPDTANVWRPPGSEAVEAYRRLNPSKHLEQTGQPELVFSDAEADTVHYFKGSQHPWSERVRSRRHRCFFKIYPSRCPDVQCAVVSSRTLKPLTELSQKSVSTFGLVRSASSEVSDAGLMKEKSAKHPSRWIALSDNFPLETQFRFSDRGEVEGGAV